MKDSKFVLRRKKLLPSTLKKVDHFLNIVHNIMTHDHKVLSHSVHKLHK